MQAALFKSRGNEFISDEFVYSSLGGETLCKLHAAYGLRWWKFEEVNSKDPKLDPKLDSDPNRFLVFCDFDGTLVESAPTGHHSLSTDLNIIPSTGKALCSYAAMGAKIVILTGRYEELTGAIKKFVELELDKISPSLKITVTVRARPANYITILDHKIMAASDELNAGTLYIGRMISVF